ncbi:unnamed protein product [Blepharisma stoltei]|uniref:RRM domain-containing protein n=1 Tax=Blepharisma stoltei TaxID=1481888 RepID=A0AAU9I7F4_9CILI|nr:unnamed protein product [Blepharisma stoltei]
MGSQQAIFASVANLVLGGNEDDSRDFEEEGILKELKNESNLEEAKKFRIKNSIVKQEADGSNPKLYSIWSTSPENLGKYGVGLELYFRFIKQMAILFFIAACLSIYPAYTNSTGSIIADGESQSGSRYTLANPYWFERDKDEFLDTQISENDKDYLPWKSDTEKEEWKESTLDRADENYKEIWIIDAIYSSIFLIGIIVILIINKIKIHDVTSGENRVSDYSIEVAGFPNENIDKEEVINHFSCFGEIMDVYLGRSYGDLLYFYKEKATVLKEIRTQKIFLGGNPEMESNNKKLIKLQNKLSKLDENITISDNKKFHNELPVHRVYIIFNSKESRAKAFTRYRKGFFGWRHNKSSKLKFRGKYQLKVYPSSEPSDIMWENLEIKRLERRSRIILSVIITIIMMCVSVALIFIMRRGSKNVFDSYKCLEYNKKELGKRSLHEIIEETESDPHGSKRACWCSLQSAEDWAQKPEIRSICMNYVYTRLSSATVNFAICFCIVVTNFILRHLLTILSDFERRKSYNLKQTHTMLKIFVAMLFNTILAPILVHIKYTDEKNVDELVEGNFSDFSKWWYLRVGSMFFIMMCISIVSPHFLFNFLVFYMRGLWRRLNSYKLYKTQYEMHNAFIGPVFLIAARTSMILTTIFTCFIFSGGVPLLNVIGFLALFVIYWTDKFLILRHYRKPPPYNHHIYSSAIKAMPLCVFFHSCVSLYAYGCPNVFPKDFIERIETFVYKNNTRIDINYLDYKVQDLEDRIIMDHGIVFLTLAILSFILFLLFEFSEKITREIKRKLLLKDHPETKKFSEIEDEMIDYALTRYDLELNPNYSYLIASMNQDVEEGRCVLERLKHLEHPRASENGCTSLPDESQRFTGKVNFINTNPIGLNEQISAVSSGPASRAPTIQSKPPSINLNFEQRADSNDKDATSTSPYRRAPKFEVQNTSLKSYSSDGSEDSSSGMQE